MAATFDTLRFAEKLEEGGFTHAQARAASVAFADASTEQLANKADLADVRADIGQVRTEIGQLRTEVRADISAVRAELRELELRMTVKMGAMMFASVGLVLGAMFTMVKALAH